MGDLSRNWRPKDSDKMRIKSPLSLVRVFWPHFGAQIGHCVVFLKSTVNRHADICQIFFLTNNSIQIEIR